MPAVFEYPNVSDPSGATAPLLAVCVVAAIPRDHIVWNVAFGAEMMRSYPQ